jgi:uncharacterized protein (UPF0297 family)
LEREIDLINQKADRVLNVLSKIYKQIQYNKLKQVIGKIKSGNGKISEE